MSPAKKRMGRQSPCLICGGNASTGQPRVLLTDVSPGCEYVPGKRLGFICRRCAGVILQGDVLTAMQREANTSQRHETAPTPGA